ncbi:MAG: DUF1302 family protein [Pseudomonadota bacterium]
MTGMIVAGLATGTVQAIEFDLAGTPIKIESLATVGALVRMQERDGSLVGKSSLGQELFGTGPCVNRNGDDRVSGPNPNGMNTFSGDTCSGTRTRPATNAPNPPNAAAVNSNTVFLQQPGALTPNGDDGNLNFDKYDIAYATAKLTSDVSFSIADFNFFTRTVGYFDGIYSSFEERHPDTTLRPLRTQYLPDAKDRSGARFQALDYFVSKKFELGERQFNIKVGNQVLNWGESAFLLANSLNSINPPDQARLRIPGFDVKELSRPVGMVLLEGDVVEGISAQAFYQYDWKHVIVDPVGSYFSVSDTLGEGGEIAMLSFAKAPEDPLQLYEPRLNSQDPIFVLNSRSSRTLLRDYELEKQYKPSEGGQYGASAKFFLENFNNGTEVAVYFANYHARIPSVSAIATQATCIPAGTNNLANPAQLVAFAAACEAGDPAALVALATSPGAQLPLGAEALPLDTGKVFVEYPENIKMYGFSFNTTIGDFAFSGEYAYRPNLPIQIHTTDLVFNLLQPGFPDQDIAIAPGLTLPGRRTAVPDFVGQFRNPGCNPNCVQPGQYIQGYEKLEIGQGEFILLKTIGGDNPLGASQITLLLEAGITHLPNLPKLSELQSNGSGTDTHISAGISGTRGINPVDIRANPADPSSHKCDAIAPGTNQTQAQATAACYTLLQNPIPQAITDIKGYGTPESYGYRFVTLTRYDSALFGANVELLNAFFHDVHGVGPGLGQNFVEGRKQILSGIRVDYLSRFIGELRYTWFTGGKNRDQLRDRDNLFLFLGYQF